MEMKKLLIIIILICLATTSFFSGCIETGATGTLHLKITDKPGDLEILQANVTISMIQVHKSEDEEKEEEYENIDDYDDGFIAEGYGPYEGDVDEDIDFIGDYIDDKGDTTSVSWLWKFGDGSTSDEQNPTYAYSIEGIYIVNLTVTNNTGVYDWYLTTAKIGEEEISDVGWHTIEEESQTFDLIELQDVKEDLGLQDLPVGKYTQIRLTIEKANITINNDGEIEVHDLKIPSNKIKLIKPFYIYEDDTTILTLDFEVNESVHKTGKDDYIMRPTIKVIEG
jgi:hypothetical protein